MTGTENSKIVIFERINGEIAVMGSDADPEEAQLLANGLRRFGGRIPGIDAWARAIHDFNEEGVFCFGSVRNYIRSHVPPLAR
jgi:hypothetical protein